MSTSARQIDLVTVEDYLALDDATEDARLEYVAGHVFALAGTTRRHAAIVRNLLGTLQALLEPRNCDAFASELRTRVARDLYFYPDVVVTCGPRPAGGRDETSPALLAEVLSDSTEQRDLGTKLIAYRAIPSLLAYLIVAQKERRVEVHWRGQEGAAWRQELVRTGAVRLPILGGLELDLDRIYARTEL